MGTRARRITALFLPVLAAVFLVVRTAWLAYVHTLNESELHLRVFEHGTAVAVMLWSVIICLAAGFSWVLAGLLGARGAGRPR